MKVSCSSLVTLLSCWACSATPTSPTLCTTQLLLGLAASPGCSTETDAIDDHADHADDDDGISLFQRESMVSRRTISSWQDDTHVAATGKHVKNAPHTDKNAPHTDKKDVKHDAETPKQAVAAAAARDTLKTAPQLEKVPQFKMKPSGQAERTSEITMPHSQPKAMPGSVVKTPVLVKAALGDSTDIWNSEVPWPRFSDRHPAGVTSNVGIGEKIKWAPVNYMNVRMLLVISCLAYPVAFLFCIMLIMFFVSTMMTSTEICDAERQTRSYLPGLDGGPLSPLSSQLQKKAEQALPAPDAKAAPYIRNSKGNKHILSAPAVHDIPLDAPPVAIPPPFGEDYAPPVFTMEQLSPFSQKVYMCYAMFCRAIPCIMVFGIPLVLVILSYPFPQEMFSVLALITSVAVFSNGVYMCIFAAFSLCKIGDSLGKDSSPPPMVNNANEAASGDLVVSTNVSQPDANSKINHWVIFPQYLEDLEVVNMAMSSVAASSIAKTNISVVLAMEKREANAEEKATEIKRRFAACFKDILITYHPPDLPNDPPGKASNSKWAFNTLVQHLWASGKQDFSDIICTVSDADSEFHECYFNELVSRYLEQPAEERNLNIYQAAILHIKNYHRQPSLVAVGTMFTSMQELAAMGDPNATQFPYSTYSLSMELVRRVGGFDAEWIAEDWHMGIKCYLLTLGQSRVVPISLPICNTTPEDDGWTATVLARWAQAKRHALGFSDISYYFMMLPLMYAYVSSKSSESRGRYIRSFWSVAIIGLRVVVRIVSVHVVIGVITTFGILEFLCMVAMRLLLPQDRHSEELWTRTDYWFRCLAIVTLCFMLMVSTMFNFVYYKAHKRIEEEHGVKSIVFRSKVVHWLYTSACFLLFGPVYFAALAYATWRASIMVLSTKALDYEVAPKRVLSAEEIRELKAEQEAAEQAD